MVGRFTFPTGIHHMVSTDPCRPGMFERMQEEIQNQQLSKKQEKAHKRTVFASIFYFTLNSQFTFRQVQPLEGSEHLCETVCGYGVNTPSIYITPTGPL